VAHTLTELRDDFDLYARNYLWIVNTERKVQPFTMNVVQKRVHSLFDPLVKKGRVFMYVLKARQEGVSTYAEGRIFHSAHLNPNTKAGVFADEVERAENIFKMSRTFYERLPDGLRPMTRYSSKRELLFENPSKHGRFANPGIRSSIEVFTAGNANVGRSWTLDVAHLSEFAFYPNGADLLESLIPTIHNVPGNFAILETTADRAGSFAKEEWLRYKAEYKRTDGQCELLPIFIPWWELPAYSQEFADEKLRAELVGTLNEEERALIARFGLTHEQLNWRRSQISLMKGDLFAFKHEYPADDEECWIFSGRPVFSAECIAKAWQGLPSNYWRGEVTAEGRLTQSDTGRFCIYHKPLKGHNYVVGVDPSGGSIDNAVISVIDVDTLEQCAEWVGVVGGVELAQYVYPIGLLYGGDLGQALVAIEITGGWGVTTQTELMGKYWNLYRWPRFDTLGAPDSTKLGWETNVRTKPLLVDFGEFLFNNDYARVNSEGLLKEMSKFCRDDNAASGPQDDRVMGWLIATFVAGSGKSDLIRRSPINLETAVVKTPMEKMQDKLFGYTLETQCDMDYYATEDEGPRSWMEY
jgi:hypothetical protein